MQGGTRVVEAEYRGCGGRVLLGECRWWREDDRRHHDSHAGHDDHEGHGHEGHDDHDDHDHGGHDHAHDLRGSSRRSLIFALVLISSYMVAEVIGGIASGSLALLADAEHMATDAAAIGLALFAMWIADREASIERTYGYYRTEILAALLNAMALWLIVGWILFEAYHRFEEFHRHGASELHIDGWLMMGVGVGGLLVNLGAAWILHRSSDTTATSKALSSTSWPTCRGPSAWLSPASWS